MKKYDNGTLFYVSDDDNDLGLDVEQARIRLIDTSVLHDAKDKMIVNALTKVQGDDDLKSKWLALLNNLDEDSVNSNHSSKSLDELKEDLFNSILKRYMKMGAAQFLSDTSEETTMSKKLTGNVW